MGDATVTLAMLQLFEDILPEELLIDQIPRRIELHPGKTIGLAVRPVRSPNGTVTAALWSLSDVTDLVAAEEENAENRAIMKILAHREAYLAFLTETWQDLARAREACVVPDPSTVRQVVSSVKGNTTLYGMERVTHLIEDVEKRSKLTVDGIEHIELAVRDFLDRHRRVLGDLARGVSTIPIPEAHLRELDAMLGDIEGLSRIRAWSYEARLQEFTSLIGPVAGAVEHLAARLGKDTVVTVEGSDLKLDPWRVAAVCRSLDHLVRNALKHGLETPGERFGKPPQGRVHVGAYATADEWRFEVTDDGRGIDVDAVRARAVERGVISAADAVALPPGEALALVFAPGMSESDQVAAGHNRVESLGAFAAVVHACGGRVEVQSEPGRGTTIIARIPRATDLALAA